MDSVVARRAIRAAYRAQQASFRAPVAAAHRALRLITGNGGAQPSRRTLRQFGRRYRDLLERDLNNAHEGIYPLSLLFGMPFGQYARTAPRFLADVPRAVVRSRRRDFRDLPEGVDLSEYPAYFRRTFHWQTDGYLSRRSAELYDLQVEFLFVGCADVMRRQVIPPVARHLEGRPPGARILDVACGTGRTIHQLARALPGHRYYGVDLSPFYVERAREELASTPNVTLAAENAEALPFRDGTFDAVTSVYLLHELPRSARRNVVSEIRRVLKPGGLVVVEDSAQLSDAEDIAFFLENFSKDMHEPFYKDYLSDDIAEIFAEAGLGVENTEPCWVAKIVTGHTPG